MKTRDISEEDGRIAPPFQVRTCGRIREAPYHSTPGTKQSDTMLYVFLEGEGVYQNHDGKIELTGGMAGLVPPDDPGVTASSVDRPYYHYYCRFYGDFAMHLAQKIIASRGSRFFEFDLIDELADLIRRMGRRSPGPLPAEMGGRELLLAEALLLLQGCQTKSGPPKLNRHTLEEYLDERIAEPTDLDMMARHFSVSKATLCRAARKYCETTVQKLHEQKKTEWAQTLLKLGSFSVREVSLRVGYSDALYFSRVFRKVTGMSPKRWAAKH